MDKNWKPWLAYAMVVFVVGAALGFGIGYAVGDSGSKPAKAAGQTSGTRKQVPQQAAFTRLVKCIGDHGVKWPGVARPNIAKPPPGVSRAKYNSAVSACYRQNATPRKTTTTKP